MSPMWAKISSRAAPRSVSSLWPAHSGAIAGATRRISASRASWSRAGGAVSGRARAGLRSATAAPELRADGVRRSVVALAPGHLDGERVAFGGDVDAVDQDLAAEPAHQRLPHGELDGGGDDRIGGLEDHG